MRLTYRDVITTTLAGAVVAVTLAVTQGWDWALLGTPRAGVLALGLLGIAMCSVGTRAADMATAEELRRHPAMIAGTVFGAIALVLLVVGLIVGTEAWLVALALDLMVLWLIATVRHAVQPGHTTGGSLAGVH
jgi:hypothetical protein